MSAIRNASSVSPMKGFLRALGAGIAGLGGRDITTQMLSNIYFEVKKSEAPRRESVWVGLQEVNRAT